MQLCLLAALSCESAFLLLALAENQHAAGRLWDMAAWQVQQSDYRLLVHYGEFLHQQPELPQLAEQLEKRVYEPAVQPEEISGIHQSDDMLRLLPGELSVLGIDELECEFYRRLLEKRLLTYLSARRRLADATHSTASQQPITRTARGPMIVCVDTSGSMDGFNEELRERVLSGADAYRAGR